MKQTVDDILQYVMPLLEELNRYLKMIPPEILLAAAGLLFILLVTARIVRFVRKRKAAGETEMPVLPEEAKAEDFPESAEPVAEPEARSTEPDTEEDPAEAEPQPVKAPKPPPPPPEKPEPEGFFSRLKSGLSKTRNTFSGGLERIFAGSRQIDDDLLEEIEELLITSDVGVQTTMQLVEKIGQQAADISSADALKKALQKEMLAVIQKGQAQKKVFAGTKPEVIMVVGVNGVGKTTTIGKLSARFREQGKKVLIVAADTFRAAAGEQLAVWAEKSGAQIVKHRDGADPAAVAYDGVEAALARDIDVVLVDTAGRLHTKVNLMEELKKIRRTIAKKLPDAPHQILMVLDATTGQNALTQAKLFHDTMGLTSIALTKLDGTAKGGIVIGICDALNIPLDYIGVGEKIDDLQEFQPEQFVEALF